MASAKMVTPMRGWHQNRVGGTKIGSASPGQPASTEGQPLFGFIIGGWHEWRVPSSGLRCASARRYLAESTEQTSVPSDQGNFAAEKSGWHPLVVVGGRVWLQDIVDGTLWSLAAESRGWHRLGIRLLDSHKSATCMALFTDWAVLS